MVRFTQLLRDSPLIVAERANPVRMLLWKVLGMSFNTGDQVGKGGAPVMAHEPSGLGLRWPRHLRIGEFVGLRKGQDDIVHNIICGSTT